MAEDRGSQVGRTAIITGAGRPVGRAIALAFAQAGARVCAVDVNPDRLSDTVSLIRENGGQAIEWAGDMSNRFQVAAMIEATRDHFGSVDSVVTTAVVDRRIPLLSIDEFDWRRSIEMNLTGAFFCTQLAARVMADEQGGAILHVIDSLGVSRFEAQTAPTSAASAAIASLARQAAGELAQSHIRVNALAVADLGRMSTKAEDSSARLSSSLLQEIAQLAAFLCSNGAALISGQVFEIGKGEGKTLLPT